MHVADFADMIVDSFAEMRELAEPGAALVMGVALHANIAGQPFRLKHLRRAFAEISSAGADCWLTYPGSVAMHYAERIQPN